MNPQDTTTPVQPEPAPQIHNPLEVMQPGEQIVCEVKRHPIGIFGIYITAGTILLILAVLSLVVAPAAVSNDRGSVMAIGMVVFLIMACIIVGFVFIANKVYWGNSWIVSSDSLTQITQTSLFNKQSSQLSLGNLEDVTSEQRGIIAQLFKFGTLKVETAGERSKFTFPYCPNPSYYAQKILAARETFEQIHRGGKQEPFKTTNALPQDQAQLQSPVEVQQQAPAPIQAQPTFPDTPYDYRQNNPGP
jgi:hypothetical protein